MKLVISDKMDGDLIKLILNSPSSGFQHVKACDLGHCDKPLHIMKLCAPTKVRK